MERLIITARRYLFLRSANPGFVHLFISKRLIHGAAAALLGIFVPIFLYKVTGESFYVVGGYYAVTFILYGLSVIWAAKLMNYYGTRVSLVLAGVCSVVFYILLYFTNETNIWQLIIPVGIFIILYRLFHWVPYHVDFAIFTKDGERGRDVSITYATVAFLGVAGPILAGYIIANSGYNVLFGISIVLLTAATISYLFVPRTYEKFEWGYTETWKKFFSREYRPIALGMLANGAETGVTLIVWPIFLYELLDGNIFKVGAVTTLVTAATILIQLALGSYLDKRNINKERTLRVGSTLYAIGWVIKIFVLSGAQVFLVGLYHNVTKIFTRTPFEAIFYDMSAEQGHYVDEFTVLREMGMSLGRGFGLIVVTLVTLFISIQWTFLIAAVAALLLNFIYQVSHE